MDNDEQALMKMIETERAEELRHESEEGAYDDWLGDNLHSLRSDFCGEAYPDEFTDFCRQRYYEERK